MTPSAAVRPLLPPDPVHDGRHSLRDLPLERESMPYVISLPEHGIATCIYTWVNKDHQAGAAFVVCGPAVGEQPILEVVDGIDVGPERNFDNWQVGPVHVEHDLRLQGARIRARSARIELDATFEAMHPAYAYSSHPSGCPDYAATDRLEQACRVSGTVSIDGNAVHFTTTGARDHSWGTRDWGTPQHWKWLHAQAGDTAVHFWQIFVGGRVDLRGYLYRDGVMAEVTSIEVDFETDPDYWQKRIQAVVQDTAGRSARIEGEYFAHFPFPPNPSCVLNEAGMRCTIDGQPGTGWTEFMWPKAYVDYLKRQPFAS